MQSITGTVPTGFVLKISTNGTDWAELDLEGPLYEAVRLYTDIAPGQDQTRDVYLMVDASGVTDRSFVGATFTITLVYTLAQLD
ncbi:MAG: hypothetical protein NZ651_00110 [Candidatus Bipolaricaulota bacterium]|nr:hypothetical protein [Candidatus Bipolaricaulota bacterium]MDW8126174.1 hypothetical protein [Candidatus Bipolaricaulota bacterium]